MSACADDELPFEKCLEELDAVVRDLEDGRLGLEPSLARYEAGVRLLQRCYGQLRAAEQRIMQLTGSDDRGQPVLAPFKHEATAPGRGK